MQICTYDDPERVGSGNKHRESAYPHELNAKQTRKQDNKDAGRNGQKIDCDLYLGMHAESFLDLINRIESFRELFVYSLLETLSQLAFGNPFFDLFLDRVDPVRCPFSSCYKLFKSESMNNV